MSTLVLMGQLKHVGEEKFISFKTQNKEHVLPIVSNDDEVEGEWVGFIGSLCTKSIPKGDRFCKVWFGSGSLFPSYEGKYANDLTVSGTIVRVDTLRTTPLTLRKIVDFVVADGDNYYNCISFGKTADRIISEKRKGSRISIVSAMFHSREYMKDGEMKTAYEVCVRDFV